MLDAKAIREICKTALTGYVIHVKPEQFSYLHHDDKSYGNRTLPALAVYYHYRTTKDFRSDDFEVLEVALRDAGYCAELSTHPARVVVIDAPKTDWPRNKIYELGSWWSEND